MTETSTKLPVSRERSQPKEMEGAWWPFDSLRSEIDRLFDDFMPSSWSRPLGRLAVTPPLRTFGLPAVDVIEKDGKYEITAELAGIEPKEVNVHVSDGTLVIRGEKNETSEKGEGEYRISERSFGSFQRSFQLPSGVDKDKIEATFVNGVLKIILPKSAEALKSERKVEIKAA